MSPEELYEFGKVGYDAYKAYSNGISLVSGARLPAWEDLSNDIREAWTQSASSIMEEYKDYVAKVVSS